MKDLFETFRVWEHKWALTFVGVILSVIFFAVPYFEKKPPGLRIEVVSRANVFDVNEKISDLDIFYKGSSLRSNQQTLAVVTLKISNDGAGPIPIGAYDPSAPVGVLISERTKQRLPGIGPEKRISESREFLRDIAAWAGQNLPFSLSIDPAITKAELISASRSYLSEHVRIAFSATNATFSPVILQTGDSFEVKILVLHGEGKDFSIKPIGEIAGVNEISFVGLNAKESPPTIWKQAFAGGTLVQAMRTVVYFLTVLLLVFAIFGPVSAISNRREKRKRRTEVDNYRQMAPPGILRSEYDWVLDAYIEDGPYAVIVLNNLLTRPDDVLNLFRSPFSDFGRDPRFVEKYKIANRLKEAGIVVKAPGGAQVDSAFHEFIKNFTEYVVPRMAESAHFYGGREMELDHS